MRSRRLGRHDDLVKASTNSLLLQQGSEGAGVAELQSLLADMGFSLDASLSGGRPDGVYGPETEKAVKEFQRRSGLFPDGVVGRDTITKLDSLVVSHSMLEVTTDDLERANLVRNLTTPVSRCNFAYW